MSTNFLRTGSAILSIICLGAAWAKLPPPTDDAKAKAAEAAVRTAWSDKIASYKLCVAMDRTADAYRKSATAAGKSTAPASPTPPCADPGPFVAAVAQDGPKPLEAAGAHSPPATAKGPPSSKATAAELAGGVKK